MRLIGLLSFYDESPTWLAATIGSLARCCDHLVAVDGAYFLYPQGRPSSGPDRAAEVVSAALACGMGITYHAPEEVWVGNEIEKRNFMIRMGLVEAQVGEDWFLIVDADEIVTHVPFGLKSRLEQAEEEVATYQLFERTDWSATPELELAASSQSLPEGSSAVRGLYRARRSLRVRGTHYGYSVVSAAGREVSLWSPITPALGTDLRLEHRRAFRTANRLESMSAYSDLRDELGVEAADQEGDGIDAGPTPSLEADRDRGSVGQRSLEASDVG